MSALAIFPLNTVLFPGGVLPLRVFEARYMDMVRDCMRNKTTFGVCLIKQGSEIARKPGVAATPEAVGCTAEITDWDMRELGVLNITTVGRERFRIVERTVESNGLIRAQIEPIEPDEREAVSDDRAGCALLLSRMIDELEHAREQEPPEEGDKRAFPFAEPYRLDDAGWVSNRLCEVLQVPLKAKQKLMELQSGRERLAIVDTWLKQNKVIG